MRVGNARCGVISKISKEMAYVTLKDPIKRWGVFGNTRKVAFPTRSGMEEGLMVSLEFTRSNLGLTTTVGVKSIYKGSFELRNRILAK